MTELFDAILLLIGMFFILVSSIGMLKLPDLMTRMHGATKAGTVGVGFVLLAVANHFATLSVAVEAIVIILNNLRNKTQLKRHKIMNYQLT